MAQSQRVHAIEPAPVSADQDAWLKAAAARKYRIKDGQVVGGAKSSVNGKRLLFYIPAPEDFAKVPDKLRALNFAGIARIIEYGVAQNATGNVQDAINKAIETGELTAGQDSDRAEQFFRALVADRIQAAGKGAGPDGKATQKQIDGTVEAQRESAFGKVTDAYFAAAHNVTAPEGKKTRGRKAATKEAVEDLELTV